MPTELATGKSGRPQIKAQLQRETLPGKNAFRFANNCDFPGAAS